MIRLIASTRFDRIQLPTIPPNSPMLHLTNRTARTRIRTACLALLALLAALLGLLLLHRGLLPLLASALPSLEIPFYDLAVFGAYRTHHYPSLPPSVVAPHPSVVRWDPSCAPGLVLVAPNGPSVRAPGPMILDARGGLVWTATGYGVVMNLQMQRFRGAPVLTFWAGDKSGSRGRGQYVMLDSHYRVVHRVQAVGDGRRGDLHEFVVTDEGTALLTVYEAKQVDLRALGVLRPAHGWVWDSVFQEVDIATGELVFEWRASDHFSPALTYYSQPLAGFSQRYPLDFFHINSIQKDRSGNYLVSSRHLHIITCIDGTTGKPLWTLGGHSSDFTDLSHGHATDFRWQHHAQWFSEDAHILSLFDNQYAGVFQRAPASHSKGTLVQLDLPNRTAHHLTSFVSADRTRAASQGSLQRLPARPPGADHVFIGWGSSAAYSEFTADGHLLCEVHLAASVTFWWERVKSYRASKALHWVGTPDTPPTTSLRGHHLHVSWNGATEVAFWRLQRSSPPHAPPPAWHNLHTLAKHSFESVFPLPDTRHRYRVLALDKHRALLAASEPVTPATHTPWPPVAAALLGVACAAVALVVAAACLLRAAARRRNGRVARWLARWLPGTGTAASEREYAYRRL